MDSCIHCLVEAALAIERWLGLGLFQDSTVDSGRNLLITHNSCHIEQMRNTSGGFRVLDDMSLMTGL